LVPTVAQVTLLTEGGYRVDEPLDDITSAALRARRGDDAAAAAFVRATQADVWRLCAHLGSRASAEDLTQETYARAFAALHRFAGRSAARTWLLAIARRVCADAVRSAVRGRTLESAADVPETDQRRPGRDPAEAVALRGLLDSLDSDRREAFVLTQLVGLSYAEAAEVCGCPVGTIRSRVARARGDLVAGLGDGREGQSRTSTG
jgi:RNA polymerase sigma-70 factor (ECF subfamily)